MRKLFVCLALASVLTAAGPAAQDDPPRFRGKVDVITVDVAAVDGKGRPIEDLKPGDFTIKVDGKVRPVVSAELIKVDTGAAAAAPSDPRISTNDAPANARRVIIAVDQTWIPPGAVTPLLYTAATFIDRLGPEDYAAFVAFPEPGTRVDFTTDKEPVKKALRSIVGSAQMIFTGDFDMSITEAFEIARGPEAIRNTGSIPGVTIGPTMRRVLERGCRGTAGDCSRDIYNEALRVSSLARVDSDTSMRALEHILEELVPLEGPKTMVLFSAGLMNDNLSLFQPLARLAAAARTTINIVYAEMLPDQQAHMPYRSSTIGFVDRSMERAGLELVADRTGGTLYRGLSAGNGIFQRIESEMSGWYLVAVERQPGDPERQKIEVAVRRRGVSVRSNRTFVSEPSRTARTTEALLNDALSSPFSIPGIPLRVSTFTQRDAETGKYRVSIAAEIGQPGQPGGEFALGYVLADERGRPKKTGGARRVLSPQTETNQPLLFDTAVTADPGTYLLRLGVVDTEGHRGTVVHRLELPAVQADAVTASDLIVGNLSADGKPLRPTVEPRVTAGALAAYLELYGSEQNHSRVTVNLEIAEGDASPALVSQPLTIRPGNGPSSRLATGTLKTTMAPGRYVARATVHDGGNVIQTVTRSFTLVAASGVATPLVR